MCCFTKAQHHIQPSRHETITSTEQATNMCWLTPEPSTTSSHKGKKQLQAHREQPACAGSSLCPSTTSSHKGNKQLQAHSKQPTCVVPPGSPALHPATKARNCCQHTAGNQPQLAFTRAQRNINHKSMKQLQSHCIGSCTRPALHQATTARNSCQRPSSN